MRVVLVIFFVSGTVLVVMWLYFMKLVDICWFNWSSLLPVIRFSVGDSLRNLCVLSQISFMHWLIRPSIDKWSCIIFFERLVFLHRVNGGLLNLRRTQLIRHHWYRLFLLVSRNHFLLVEVAHMTNCGSTSVMLWGHHLHTSSLLNTFGNACCIIVWNSLVYSVWSNVLAFALKNLAFIRCINKVRHVTIATYGSTS